MKLNLCRVVNCFQGRKYLIPYVILFLCPLLLILRNPYFVSLILYVFTNINILFTGNLYICMYVCMYDMNVWYECVYEQRDYMSEKQYVCLYV